MRRARDHESETRRLRPSPLVVVLAGAAVGAAVLWSGCTVTEENYEFLSLLFDGVPKPAERDPETGQVILADITDSPTYSAHRPYVEENCTACHRGRLTLSRDDSVICMQCHAEETSRHERMHGPVAAGACLWCHSPHESAYAALLRDADRKVCSTCHSEGLLSTETVPAHADRTRACLECHYGHGGTTQYLLKPGAGGREPAPGAAPAPER